MYSIWISSALIFDAFSWTSTFRMGIWPAASGQGTRTGWRILASSYADIQTKTNIYLHFIYKLNTYSSD